MNIFKRLTLITVASTLALMAITGSAYAKALYGSFAASVWPGSATHYTQVAAHPNKLYFARCTPQAQLVTQGAILVEVAGQSKAITPNQWQVTFRNLHPIYNVQAQNGELKFKFYGTEDLKGTGGNPNFGLNCEYYPQK